MDDLKTIWCSRMIAAVHTVINRLCVFTKGSVHDLDEVVFESLVLVGDFCKWESEIIT